ncbi:uncharacterized protein LOC129612941 [Condylostylus longicornis]|uniref:uncharacterized protein LOC129612941 n=1 Tax=Condylostylus longicornis TaxID=2530218 RepID=UPI00244DE551|nr:uncharacterized protein LOC129612941 [Condylostylus longicornis]
MDEKFFVNERERNVTQLNKLIRKNANTSKGICEILSKIEKLILLPTDFSNNFEESHIQNWAKKAKGSAILENIQDVVAVIDRAIQLKRKFKLRDTQKLAVITLLLNKRNTLAQVCTGEGKSLIVVAISIAKALCNQKVDIITSSSVLAKRDAEENKDIYSLFNISVSHNCNEDIEIRKKSYWSNVVYGDLSNFQRDYLLHEFYQKNILGDRARENIIVDEVDSMLLDKGNNMLYLSHDMPDFDKLESVYVYIWQWVNKPASSYSELSNVFNVKVIKKAILSQLYDAVKRDDIKKFDSKLSQEQIQVIWERLLRVEILDHHGVIIKENVTQKNFINAFSTEFECYTECAYYFFKEFLEREKQVRLPNYLKPFVEEHLETWISSAITAFFMKPGQDYVVDVDRTKMNPDRNPNITIIDRDTGTDQSNSQWDEALHQFLQLKHGCKLSLQNLKAVFISNVSFFKMYKKLYGMTGTLGSQREKDFLQELHDVDFVIIPTARSKQFVKSEHIVCSTKEEWINSIYKQTKSIVENENRSVLIICETVNDVDSLYNFIGKKTKNKIYTYTRDYEEFNIAQGNQELEQNQIIIATNLAGRGTDIKLKEKLKEAGGLHVCLTYLPKNVRIEEQAFGRAGRCGDKGSGQLIVKTATQENLNNSKIFALKAERNAEELHHISEVKAYYETQIITEENCFKNFKEEYIQLNKSLSIALEDKSVVEEIENVAVNVANTLGLTEMPNKYDLKNLKYKNELRELLLQSCLDKWAFWLNKHSLQIKTLKNSEVTIFFNNSLREFLQCLRNLKCDSVQNLQDWVSDSPVKMIKLAKFFTRNEKFGESINLLNNIIKQEPSFSEAAHYYKAYTIAKQIDWESSAEKNKKSVKEFKNELREAAKLFDENCKFFMYYAGVIGKVKNKSKGIVQINAYEEQKNKQVALYQLFSSSIDEIFGKFITLQQFHEITDEKSSKCIHEELIKENILKKPHVKKNISEKEIANISVGYGISARKLNDFLLKCKNISSEEKFEKMLKEEIRLPNKEEFWEFLLKENILRDESKYIVLNKKKFDELDPTLTDEKNKSNLMKEKINFEDGIVFFDVEKAVTFAQVDFEIFKKDCFLKFIEANVYEKLEKDGVINLAKAAMIDLSNIDSINFPSFDFITLEDFAKVDIKRNEAEKILLELVENNILKIKNAGESTMYKLEIKYDEIENIHLNSSVYENSVQELLRACFTYRIAFQKLIKQKKENNSCIWINLASNPYSELLAKLLEARLFKLATVLRTKKSLNEEIKTILNNLKNRNLIDEKLCKEDIINNVTKILESVRSSLKAYKVPEFNLKELTKFFDQGDFSNVEEMENFFLNGLNDVIQLEEKKWTREMIFNTLIVISLGISQIIIGSIIELYFGGFATHLASGVISEGISDIMFAAGALKSGYFNWKDYGTHKLQSIAFTAATIGVGAIFSAGTKVSRYGRKLAGPDITIKGKKVAEMYGSELIKAVGLKSVGVAVTKRIMLKTFQGITFSLANAGIDYVIENNLRTYCKRLAFDILSDTKNKIDNHKISASIKELFDTFGENKANEILRQVLDSHLKKKDFTETLLSTYNKAAESLVRGIGEGFKKLNERDDDFMFTITILTKALRWTERGYHIMKISQVTIDSLNAIDIQIREKINSKSKIKTDKNPKCEMEGNEKDFETFKKNANDQLKAVICGKMEQFIEEHIVKPVITKGTHKLITYAGEKLKEAYRYYKESEYFNRYKNLKNDYEKELQNNEKSGDDSDVKNHITKKYHKSLRELAIKTKNPKLFAAIVRENVEMDITCVGACAKVVTKILKNQGINKNITVVVETENGVQQTFSTSNEGETQIIKLNIKDNHFTLSENNNASSNIDDSSLNNCLYEALVQAVPQLRGISSQDFRNAVADHIEKDPEIQYHIQQNWHSVPLQLGAFGGEKKRRKSCEVSDPESSPTSVDELGIKHVDTHFVDRFLRMVRVDGIIQRISEDPNVSLERNDIVKGGRSKTQDRSGSVEFPAAHVVRGQVSELLKKHEKHSQELNNILGHTQIVPQYGNDWHGIGGVIDRYQENHFNNQNQYKCDFSKSALENYENIQGMRTSYLDVLEESYNSEKFSFKQKQQFKSAISTIRSFSPEEIFRQGQMGYYQSEGADVYSKTSSKRKRRKM